MYVAPSLLSADFLHLGDEIAAVSAAGADLLHIDVMDGAYVPNISIGLPTIAAIARAATIPLDIHLMIEQPERLISDFCAHRPRFVSFHPATTRHPLRLCERIRELGSHPAVALNPHEDLSALDYLLDGVDMVLLMSVNPGFGGQKFYPATLRKIAALRELIDSRGAKCLIEVDGGVSGANIAEIAEAGADIAVAGSFIFGAQDYAAAIAALKR